MGLGDQPKLRTVTVKAPGPSLFDNLDPRLVMPVQKLVRNLAIWRFIRQFHSGRTIPLDIDHGDKAVLQDALNGRIRPEIFEPIHFVINIDWSKYARKPVIPIGTGSRRYVLLFG